MENNNISRLHRNAYKLLSSIKRDSPGSPSIMDSMFFASFIGNAVFDVPNKRRRFSGSRLKFFSVLSLGFDAESFYVKMREHLKQKGFDVNLCAISVLPFLTPWKYAPSTVFVAC